MAFELLIRRVQLINNLLKRDKNVGEENTSLSK